MVLSVIIVSYNSSSFLELCLISVQKSFLEAKIKSEIIVVDNSSSDDSCEVIKNKFPSVLLIKNKVNLGFSKANNIGVSKANGRYICILNPDTVLMENTFSKILDFYKSKKKVGFVGCHMIDGNGVFLRESKRSIPSFFSSLMKIIGISKFYYSNLDKNERGYIDVLAGAFMFTEKHIYDSVNGFDEDYFMYGEDIDLSYKVLKRGYLNYYLGDVKIIHFKGESTDKNSTYISRFYNAMYIFYLKHFNKYLLSKIFMFSFFKFIISFNKLAMLSVFNNKLSYSNIYYDNKFLVTRSSVDKFNFKGTKINLDYIKAKKIQNSLIVFDLNSIFLSEIIHQYELLSKTNSFRIIVPNTNFYIGSDYENRKGQIVHF
ncbi:glycosyltransferase family 2 protein [Flavobacteriaceae bacterium]|nr:glycosyltransferase family 2 protein [Flavobacteriaceae bacterium]MDC1534860.1 glycosyltransferase family 2 protein [Flavobacteriaceae bacterium]